MIIERSHPRRGVPGFGQLLAEESLILGQVDESQSSSGSALRPFTLPSALPGPCGLGDVVSTCVDGDLVLQSHAGAVGGGRREG